MSTLENLESLSRISDLIDKHAKIQASEKPAYVETLGLNHVLAISEALQWKFAFEKLVLGHSLDSIIADLEKQTDEKKDELENAA